MKKEKVSVVLASLEGELSIKKIDKELVLSNPIIIKDRKYINFTLDNTGTAGTNPMTVYLLIQTKE